MTPSWPVRARHWPARPRHRAGGGRHVAPVERGMRTTEPAERPDRRWLAGSRPGNPGPDGRRCGDLHPGDLEWLLLPGAPPPGDLEWLPSDPTGDSTVPGNRTLPWPHWTPTTPAHLLPPAHRRRDPGTDHRPRHGAAADEPGAASRHAWVQRGRALHGRSAGPVRRQLGVRPRGTAPAPAARAGRHRRALAVGQIVLAAVAAVLAATGGSLVTTGLLRAPDRPPSPVSAAERSGTTVIPGPGAAFSPVGSASGTAGSSGGTADPGTGSTPGLPAPGTGTKSQGPAAIGFSVPVSLDIPAIGVHTALSTLGLNTDGTVALPPTTRDAPAGWYRNLPSPGQDGPAVILGHVDSARDGPAVFYRLGALHPGDTATVRRADGSTATFTVDRVARYPKAGFPAGDVYGPVAYPKLTLVTCGGTFDRSTGSYRDNVLVYARLTSTSPAAA